MGVFKYNSSINNCNCNVLFNTSNFLFIVFAVINIGDITFLLTSQTKMGFHFSKCMCC